MNGYMQNGDAGVTNLKNARNVSKSDDRVRFLGEAEELISHLGLIKASAQETSVCQTLERIQKTLLTIQDGIADSYNTKYKIEESQLADLLQDKKKLEEQFVPSQNRVLPGTNPFSAQVDVAVSVARRAERSLAAVSVKFGADHGAKRYLNEISHYLYALARYAENHEIQKTEQFKGGISMNQMTENTPEKISENLIQEVLKRIGETGKITLASAKKLIQKVEEEAERRGKKAVIAVCNPEGNPIAVHVMDGAFLVSFDVAVKKAYTSVAVKMSTMELAALAQPGQTFYGVDKMDGGKIVIFGGGVPLKAGNTIIGGLGISGGTAEEDHSLAEYALSVLPEVL